MNEDFAPFELAKKLKEKGFPQRTFGSYDMIGSTYFSDGTFYKDGCICHKDEAYTAPTISQALKWLRDEKKIYIISQPFASMATTDKVVWSWHWKHNSDGEFIDITYSDDTSYISYEEASVAGINYVLDNVI